MSLLRSRCRLRRSGAWSCCKQSRMHCTYPFCAVLACNDVLQYSGKPTNN